MVKLELPLSIFYGSIAFFFSLPIIGYLFKTNIPISAFFFASGMLMLALVLAVDAIQVPENPLERVTTYNSTTIIQTKEPFDFSLEGENYQLKVFWVVIAVLLIIGGVMIEVKFR